jgi:8-oxo-dGTP pyrophosphatase MutT (NUDIX family)
MSKRPLPKGYKLFSEKAEKVFSGTRFDIYQWKQKLFNGSMVTFEIAKRNDTVVIIPIIDEEIVLVKERQPHWDKDALVLVGGVVEKEEELEAAARRECAEETGMIFKDFYLVDVRYPTPGVEWGIYTFIAKNLLEMKEKKLDAGEKNEVMKLSFADVIDYTKKGKFLYSPLMIEKYLLNDQADSIFDMFRNPEKYILK